VKGVCDKEVSEDPLRIMHLSQSKSKHPSMRFTWGIDHTQFHSQWRRLKKSSKTSYSWTSRLDKDKFSPPLSKYSTCHDCHTTHRTHF